MPAQFNITGISAVSEIEADPSSIIFGHAYDASASCMNSMQNSVNNTVNKRDEREGFIDYPNYGRIIIRSAMMACQVTSQPIKLVCRHRHSDYALTKVLENR